VLRIRPVQPQDIYSVITLAYDTLPERYNPAIFNQFYESFPDGFLIAEEFHSLIGFIIGVKTTQTTARILMLSVDDSQRKKGVGSALLRQFLKEMKLYYASGVELEVRITNATAIAFYKKHGFIIQDTLKGFYQNGEDAYSMKKEL
jgi:[ribosomal protein S18]-alanine N-acetyltransferase